MPVGELGRHNRANARFLGRKLAPRAAAGRQHDRLQPSEVVVGVAVEIDVVKHTGRLFRDFFHKTACGRPSGMRWGLQKTLWHQCHRVRVRELGEVGSGETLPP